MGNYLSLPILALAAALQATILPQISLQGGGPNLVLLFVLSWALNADLREGVIWAFVGGIMLDMFSALPLGSSVVALVMLVFAISGIGQQFYRLGLMTLALLTVGGTLLQLFTQMVLMIMFDYRVNIAQDLLYVVLPTLVYNLLLILPVYWLTRRIQRRVTVLSVE